MWEKGYLDTHCQLKCRSGHKQGLILTPYALSPCPLLFALCLTYNSRTFLALGKRSPNFFLIAILSNFPTLVLGIALVIRI
jgi:hypothetical protein